MGRDACSFEVGLEVCCPRGTDKESLGRRRETGVCLRAGGPAEQRLGMSPNTGLGIGGARVAGPGVGGARCIVTRYAYGRATRAWTG